MHDTIYLIEARKELLGQRVVITLVQEKGAMCDDIRELKPSILSDAGEIWNIT